MRKKKKLKASAFSLLTIKVLLLSFIIGRDLNDPFPSKLLTVRHQTLKFLLSARESVKEFCNHFQPGLGSADSHFLTSYRFPISSGLLS